MLWFVMACTGGDAQWTDDDLDGFPVEVDCDDNDNTVFPGAAELCDGLDQDCDDEIDEGTGGVWLIDKDGDGWGTDDGAKVNACEQPEGYVAEGGDCDDLDATATPETVWYRDVDGDGYGLDYNTIEQCTQPNGYILVGGDCNDEDPSVHAGAEDFCDGVDRDCDGTIDEDDSADAVVVYEDADLDGYGNPDSSSTACEESEGWVLDATDCDDTLEDVNPGVPNEYPGDGIDQNCDGSDTCPDLDCDGLVDLVLVESYDGDYGASIWVYFNNGSGFGNGSSREIENNAAGYEPQAADLNGDGYLDLVVPNYRDASGAYQADSYIYWGTGNGPSTNNRKALPTQGARRTLVHDFDADGYPDVAFAEIYNGSSYVIDSHVYWGPDFDEETATALPTQGARALAVGDVDGDGWDDLAVCNYYNTSSNHAADSAVFFGSGDGFDPELKITLRTYGCQDVAVEDLNGDGYDDVVFANYTSGGDNTLDSPVLWGTPTRSTAYVDTLPTYGATSILIEDWNQDGQLDLAFSGYYSGSWNTDAQVRIYWGSAWGYSSSVRTNIDHRGANIMATADLDGDGWMDLVLPRYRSSTSSSSYNTTSRIYFNGPEGFDPATYTSVSTRGAASVAVGDVDHDGLPDIVFGNYYSGSWGAPARSQVYTSDSLWEDFTELESYGVWAAPLLVGLPE